MNGAGPRTSRTGRRAGAAIGVGLLLLSLGTAQVIKASIPGAETRSGIVLVPGIDSSKVCTAFPCGQVLVQGSGEARVAMSLGIEAVEDHQAETYYTDLLQVSNPSNATVTVLSVAVSGISYTRTGDLGKISVFYCQVQSNDPGGRCPSSFTISNGTGGEVFQGSDVLASGSSAYIEFSGFAGPAAQAGDSVSFRIQVTGQ